MIILDQGAVVLGNDCKTRLRLCQSWKCTGSCSFLCLSAVNCKGLWRWPVSGRVLAEQDLHAVGTEGCQQGLFSSNLSEGALEVCHSAVGGWRDSKVRV